MDIVCFYIISYTIINCITTVYRSYWAKAIRITVVVRVTVRIDIAQVVVVQVTRGVNIAHIEVTVVRVRVDITRG